MSYEQKTLIEVRERPFPSWFKETKTTPAWMVTNVRRGRHPLGHPLLVPFSPNATCMNCTHRKRYEQAAIWYKCDIFGANTSGPGTDLKGYWAACDQWHKQAKDAAS